MGKVTRRALPARLESLHALRADVARYARKMSASGLVRATQGNLSVRDHATGLVCITPSAADYDSLEAEDITVVTLDGGAIAGRWRPSVEAPAHLAIYRRRPDVGCVMHTHSIYASVYSALYQPIPLLLAEAAYCLGSNVPIAPYQESGTAAFGSLVAEILGDHSAMLWGDHGALVVASSPQLAFSVAHALEDSAHIAYLACKIGEPRPLPDGEAERLHTKWKASYGQRALTDASDR